VTEVYLCGQCGAKAPPVDSGFTLIGARFGWRLLKVARSDGTLGAVWNCPECWSETKRESERRLLAARR
jgi:DNA-directed RNA polymerase subunit RPC12/RpoP